MSNEDGAPVPFPTDKVAPDRAVFGRTSEGLIFMVLPPIVVGTTFMLLVANHISASCEFVNGLAYHMDNEDVVKTGIASPKLVAALRENMLERHGITSLTEGVVKKGTADTFDGSYYAEIHPIELAAIGIVVNDIRQSMPPSLETPVVTGILELWSDAAERFVRPNERLALAGDAGVA